MKISILIEGRTEKAFIPHLRRFLEARLAGRMPKLDPVPYDGRLPKEGKLKRVVENLLNDGLRTSDAVIALTDIYTGTTPHDFETAKDAKDKMRKWVGVNDRFHPHAAQYDFEAWLLPYWDDIKNLTGHNKNRPTKNAETVNHDEPPSRLIKELFLAGSKGKAYVKPRDVNRILSGKDLLISARECSELKAFLNTILTLCDGEPII